MHSSCNEKLALLNQAQFPSIPSFFDGKHFLHHVMGEYLIARHQVCLINDSLHIYDNGIYRHGEELLHGYMLDLAPELKDSQRKEVYKYLRVSRSTPVKQLSPPHLIPFHSRIYDLEHDCFLPYSPEHVFLTRFPYDYHPDAPEQETLTRFMQQISDGDDAVRALLYEAIGHCFYLTNQYRGAVFLYGASGNNGKSTLLNLIAQLLGRENLSHLSLQDTAEKFRLIKIYGKAANIGDDIPESCLPDSSVFKRLVTGEAVTAENKGREPITFSSFAKLFFAMNELPSVKDKSQAFYGRLLLIPMMHDFSRDGTQDVTLKNRVWSQAEMEYLTRLAVEGLRRLMKQNDFTRPAIVTQALEDYARAENPLLDYLEEFPIESGEPIQDAYLHYKNWAECRGHRPVYTQAKFSRFVCAQLNMKSHPVRHRNYPKRLTRCFVTLLHLFCHF